MKYGNLIEMILIQILNKTETNLGKTDSSDETKDFIIM